MGNKVNKRSLKKRINHMLSTLNFYNLLIMLITLMLALGFTFKIFSSIVASSAASQLSLELSDEIRNKTSSGELSKVYTKGDLAYNEIFKSVGMSYDFDSALHDTLNEGIKHLEIPRGALFLSLQ